MSSHKDHSHLVRIKDEIKRTRHLSEEEKTLTMKHIDEWILEDKASGALYKELIDLASGVKPMLAELGLI